MESYDSWSKAWETGEKKPENSPVEGKVVEIQLFTRVLYRFLNHQQYHSYNHPQSKLDHRHQHNVAKQNLEEHVDVWSNFMIMNAACHVCQKVGLKCLKFKSPIGMKHVCIKLVHSKKNSALEKLYSQLQAQEHTAWTWKVETQTWRFGC